MKVSNRLQNLIDDLAYPFTFQKREIRRRWVELSETGKEWVIYRMTISRRTPTYAELYIYTCMMYNVNKFMPGTRRRCKTHRLFPEDLELASKTVHRIVEDFQKQKILSEDFKLKS